ncbi:MAG: hypothetical protein QOI63_1942, partial [Thermoplasmata archaeon]|nr:hypothetical protein [Thermoplasmata archaeon]
MGAAVADSKPRPERLRRPAGIDHASSFLHVVAAFLGWGALWAIPTRLDFKPMAFGVSLLGLAILLAAAARGVRHGRRWGWRTAVAVAALGILWGLAMAVVGAIGLVYALASGQLDGLPLPYL